MNGISMPNEPSKDSICNALFVLYNASSSQSQRNAVDQYLQSVKEAEHGLTISIDLFQNTMESPVLFYCLIVMEHNIDKKYHELSQESLITMNKLLLSFIEKVCSKPSLFASIQLNVREKIAQILVKLMKRQYLLSWHTFFKDLGDILQHGDGCLDMYFRVLQDLNWSIHEAPCDCADELSVNTAIKDRMRENDLQSIVEIWYAFLGNYQQYNNVEVTRKCLQTIDKYIAWIDIGFISAPRFVHILYALLNVSALQEKAVDCLYELVIKRMDDTQKKFNLLQALNIVAVVSNIDIDSGNNALAEALSELIEAVGLQMIGCCKDNVSGAQPLLFECYNVALRYFSHPSFKVNQECCEFLYSFWSLIKRQNDRNRNNSQHRSNHGHSMDDAPQLSDGEKVIFNKTVELISRHLGYPNEYDLDDPDEAEAEFDEYRKSKLDKLIDSMTRAYPDYMLDLIGTHFVQTCQRITTDGAIANCNEDRKRDEHAAATTSTSYTWQSIESDLHFIYKICEDYNTRHIDELIRTNAKFGQLFECSLSANICAHYAHPKVLLTYFDIIHRYNVFFEYHPEHLPQVLQLFVMCIQQPTHLHAYGLAIAATLRARACYFLQKLMAKLYALNVDKVKLVLLQCMETLISSLGGCLELYVQQNRNLLNGGTGGAGGGGGGALSNNLARFDTDDAKNICAVLGQLVLLSSADKLYAHSSKICGLFVSELKNYIASTEQWRQCNSVDVICDVMCGYIQCVQNFFKPFDKLDAKQNADAYKLIKSILSEFTGVVIKSYACMPTNDHLRKDSITFLHKIVSLLRDDILHHLHAALPLYVQFLHRNNCVLTLQIITNLVISLRNAVVPILDSLFVSLFENLSNILSASFNSDTVQNIGLEHDKIHNLDIQKHFYTFILKTFQCGCFQIFLSTKNAPHFDKVIDWILKGCVIRHDVDVSVYKSCFSILKEMLLAIKNTHPCMKDLFCNKVTKITFDFAFDAKYKADNPDFERTLKTHIFDIHHWMFKIFGLELVTNCIGTYLVTQCHVDADIAKQYCQLCTKGQHQKKLRDLVMSMRSMATVNPLNQQTINHAL